jgi:hypothetical protein
MDQRIHATKTPIIIATLPLHKHMQLALTTPTQPLLQPQTSVRVQVLYRLAKLAKYTVMTTSQQTTIQSTKLKKGNDLMISPKLMLSHIFVGALCFYWGLMGAQATLHNHTQIDCTSDVINPERKPMLVKIKKQAERIQALTEQLKGKVGQRIERREEAAEDTESRFPRTISSFMGGMATVDRTAFAKRFDVGVPVDKDTPSNAEVLLIYSHPNAAPTSDSFKAAESLSNTRIPKFDDTEMATENCDLLNLILTQPNDKRQCFAFMGQYRSYHMFKFMRLPGEQGQRLDQSSPLRLVNRGAQSSGRLSAKVPRKAQTRTYWKTLTTYLQNLESTLEALKPVAERAAAGNSGRAIVVMVCNHGQSELLMNFACSSRARGFNITSVLVFATDEETKELAEGLGMNVFFDEKVGTALSFETLSELAFLLKFGRVSPRPSGTVLVIELWPHS